jgi:hypothetical protein
MISFPAFVLFKVTDIIEGKSTVILILVGFCGEELIGVLYKVKKERLHDTGSVCELVSEA